MMPRRICRDCKHHDVDTLECLHERAEQPNIVTGDIERWSCQQMRVWPCGPEGKLFEEWPDVHRELIDGVTDALNDLTTLKKEPF